MLFIDPEGWSTDSVCEVLAVQAEDLSQIPLPMCLCYLSGAVIKIPWPGELIQDGLGFYFRKHKRSSWWGRHGSMWHVAVEAGNCHMMNRNCGTERAKLAASVKL